MMFQVSSNLSLSMIIYTTEMQHVTGYQKLALM